MSRRNTGPDKDTVDLVLKRDGYACVRCGHEIRGERGVGWSVQHRRPRGSGGSRDPRLNQPANLVILCGSAVTNCHGEVEKNRAASRAYGYLVSQHSIADPADVPVLVTTSPGGDVPEIEWRLLDNTGGWVRYEHEENHHEAA